MRESLNERLNLLTMKIEENLLLSVGSVEKIYHPGEVIFREGDLPNNYYQMVSGKVKLNNYKEDGKEFIQGIVMPMQSFGDAVVLANKPYPMNAVAIQETALMVLNKNQFQQLLLQFPEISIKLNKCISERLYSKFVMMKNNSSLEPITRLKGLMDYLKSCHEDQRPFSFMVNLTRQEMASLTGLSVETTIRTIKAMERNQQLKIKDRKIFY